MQACRHLIYRTACHQYVAACHMPPILYRTIRLSIPMERGALTRNSACRTSMPILGTGNYRIYKEPMQWMEYHPVCTGTITDFGLYCQRLFSSLFYPPFRGLAGGMPTMSRGTVPLDRYRVSHITDLVKHFFGFFLLFLTFSRGGAGSLYI